ncbi:MAG: dienelactone hydrolase family protein [Pseudomonadales bacterium]
MHEWPIRLTAALFTALLAACGQDRHNATIIEVNATNMNKPDTGREVIHNPSKQKDIRHAIIWLHGLGATADDFPPVVPHLGLSNDRAIRFVFPQAPKRPVTINGGMVMPAWYDIGGTSIEEKQDREGMQHSQQILESLVNEQITAGVPAQNIIAAGFSQGGAVAYYTALRSRHRLGGILALSTYLPFAREAIDEHSGVNLDTPIFAAHGEIDPMVPIAMGKNSAEALGAMGYKVEWKTYRMAHEVVMQELVDIGAWINRIFSDKENAD